jgi:hypothetical protein
MCLFLLPFRSSTGCVDLGPIWLPYNQNNYETLWPQYRRMQQVPLCCMYKSGRYASHNATIPYGVDWYSHSKWVIISEYLMTRVMSQMSWVLWETDGLYHYSASCLKIRLPVFNAARLWSLVWKCNLIQDTSADSPSYQQSDDVADYLLGQQLCLWGNDDTEVHIENECGVTGRVRDPGVPNNSSLLPEVLFCNHIIFSGS